MCLSKCGSLSAPSAHLNATLKVQKEKPLHLRASDRERGGGVLYVQATSLSLDILARILVKHFRAIEISKICERTKVMRFTQE